MHLALLPWQMDDLTENEAELLFEYLAAVKQALRT